MWLKPLLIALHDVLAVLERAAVAIQPFDSHTHHAQSTDVIVQNR